jgi:hypothetical protein
MSDPSERVLDCSEEPQVGLMQLDLKFCFGIRIRLVHLIASQPPAAGIGLSASALPIDIPPRFSSSTRLYRSKSFLFISDFVVSIGKISDWCAISYTHEKAVSAPRMKTALHGRRYGAESV